MTRPVLLALFAGLLVLVPAASAHATAYNTGNAANYQVKVLYGNLEEPATTFQRDGLDLQVSDAHGNPLIGLECMDAAGKTLARAPLTTLTLSYGDQVLDLHKGCTAQTGKPGAYTFPVIYTKPGAYTLRLKGIVNGTAVNMVIQPAHLVEDSASEMFPVKVDTPDQAATRLAKALDDLDALKARITTLEGKASRGASGASGGLLVLGVVACLGLAAARRWT